MSHVYAPTLEHGPPELLSPSSLYPVPPAIYSRTTAVSLPLRDHGDDGPASSKAFRSSYTALASRGSLPRLGVAYRVIFRRVRSVHRPTNPLGNGPACYPSLGARKLCKRGATNYLYGA
jgi:hypothetical protein